MTDTPTVTGVPPHIIIISNTKILEEKIDYVGNDVMERMVEYLNKIGVGGGVHHAV